MRIRARAVAGLTALGILAGGVPAAAAPATHGYIFDATNRAVIGFDPATNTITERIPLGFQADLRVRPDGRELYAANISANSGVTVISTASNTVVATIAVTAPRGLVFAPDSRRAYLISDRSLAVIDTGTRRVVRTIAIPGFPYAPAVSPDGSRVYVGFDPSSGIGRQVAVISTATGTLTRTIPLVDGRAASHLTFSPNGRLALVNTGDVIDTTTGTVVRSIPGVSGVDLVFTPDGARVYLAEFCAPRSVGSVRVLDLASGQVTTIFTGGNPNTVAPAPDFTRLYVSLASGGDVVVFDTASNGVVDNFGVATPAGGAPLLSRVLLSATAPPVSGPGQRFGPVADARNLCNI
jgi:YVTN family beta-propeller protein